MQLDRYVHQIVMEDNLAFVSVRFISVDQPFERRLIDSGSAYKLMCGDNLRSGSQYHQFPFQLIIRSLCPLYNDLLFIGSGVGLDFLEELFTYVHD